MFLKKKQDQQEEKDKENINELKEEDPKEENEGNSKKENSLIKKLSKMIAVGAYVTGISGPGFLLSLYFIYFWDPKIDAKPPPGYTLEKAKQLFPINREMWQPKFSYYNKHETSLNFNDYFYKGKVIFSIRNFIRKCSL